MGRRSRAIRRLFLAALSWGVALGLGNTPPLLWGEEPPPLQESLPPQPEAVFTPASEDSTSPSGREADPEQSLTQFLMEEDPIAREKGAGVGEEARMKGFIQREKRKVEVLKERAEKRRNELERRMEELRSTLQEKWTRLLEKSRAARAAWEEARGAEEDPKKAARIEKRLLRLEQKIQEQASKAESRLEWMADKERKILRGYKETAASLERHEEHWAGFPSERLELVKLQKGLGRMAENTEETESRLDFRDPRAGKGMSKLERKAAEWGGFYESFAAGFGGLLADRLELGFRESQNPSLRERRVLSGKSAPSSREETFTPSLTRRAEPVSASNPEEGLNPSRRGASFPRFTPGEEKTFRELLKRLIELKEMTSGSRGWVDPNLDRLRSRWLIAQLRKEGWDVSGHSPQVLQRIGERPSFSEKDWEAMEKLPEFKTPRMRTLTNYLGSLREGLMNIRREAWPIDKVSRENERKERSDSIWAGNPYLLEIDGDLIHIYELLRAPEDLHPLLRWLLQQLVSEIERQRYYLAEVKRRRLNLLAAALKKRGARVVLQYNGKEQGEFISLPPIEALQPGTYELRVISRADESVQTPTAPQARTFGQP